MFEPLPYHTGNAHTHTQTALLRSGFTFFTVAFVVFRLKITQPCVFCRSKGLLKCSGFTFFTVAFVVFRLKITQPCVFCRSKGLLKCCPYVTHIHTYNTNVQKIKCLHIHRYAYLYEHVQIFYLDICIPSLELLYSLLSTRPLHWYMQQRMVAENV